MPQCLNQSLKMRQVCWRQFKGATTLRCQHTRNIWLTQALEAGMPLAFMCTPLCLHPSPWGFLLTHWSPSWSPPPPRSSILTLHAWSCVAVLHFKFSEVNGVTHMSDLRVLQQQQQQQLTLVNIYFVI